MRIAACLLLALTCPPVAAHDMKQHSQDAAGTRIVASAGAPVEQLVLPDIPVTDKEGATAGFVSRLAQAGPVLIGFSYTGCVSLCPITHAILADVDQGMRGSKAPPLTIVTLSIDPANDTPERLAATARELDASPRWQWLVASPADTPALLSALGVASGPIESHDPVFLLGDMASGEFRRIVGLPDPRELLRLAGAMH